MSKFSGVAPILMTPLINFSLLVGEAKSGPLKSFSSFGGYLTISFSIRALLYSYFLFYNISPMNLSLRVVPSSLLETGRFLSMRVASSSLERSRVFLRTTSLSRKLLRTSSLSLEKTFLFDCSYSSSKRGDVSRSLFLSISLIAATALYKVWVALLSPTRGVPLSPSLWELLRLSLCLRAPLLEEDVFLYLSLRSVISWAFRERCPV